MKKIFFALGLAALLLGSCIKDDSSTEFRAVDKPVVALNPDYGIPIGGNLKIEPQITWSGDLSKAKMRYLLTPISGTKDEPYVVEAAADGSVDQPITLTPGQYTCRLEFRVPDDSGINPQTDGMVYYFECTVTLGTTSFSKGLMILANEAGQAKLHFITPDGTMVEDVFRGVNLSDLPGEGYRLLFPISFMGGFECGWVVATRNGGQLDGVILHPNTLVVDRKMQDSFGPKPGSYANPGDI